MDTTHMIDVTGIDLIKTVQEAYALSRPQGLGFLHFQEGDLSEDETKAYIREESEVRSAIPLSLDYVKGCSVKLTVFAHEGALVHQ